LSQELLSWEGSPGLPPVMITIRPSFSIEMRTAH
jgi:hypothetical protein